MKAILGGGLGRLRLRDVLEDLNFRLASEGPDRTLAGTGPHGMFVWLAER